jgi:hypothetical protein
LVGLAVEKVERAQWGGVNDRVGKEPESIREIDQRTQSRGWKVLASPKTGKCGKKGAYNSEMGKIERTNKPVMSISPRSDETTRARCHHKKS